MATIPISLIDFGKNICSNLAAAESREWLVTNGLGGFASGTMAGSLTRRYHGLLFAALQPPVARTLLVSAVHETANGEGVAYSLATARWRSGAIDPQGFQSIEKFRLEGTIPVWTYALGEALLEKRIWMRPNENTAYVQYRLSKANSPLALECKVLVNYRDFHAATHAGDWHMKIVPVEHGAMVLAFDGATPFYLKSASASCEPCHIWYRDFFYPIERDRGLDDHEDHLFAATFRASLSPGESVTLVFSTEPNAVLDGDAALAERNGHDAQLLATWRKSQKTASASARPEIQQLVLAADQFLVQRRLPDDENGHSILAGYHWFNDWGRDTMIALPGLALATGRPEIARQILVSFSKFVDSGMLPNNFPDSSAKPEYNTVDAALWYFEAVRQYFERTQDKDSLSGLFPVLSAIVDGHVKGTRYNIHVDPSDGLLFAGTPGVQLTWMDAKIGDWVVTPRMGKPVEINALWINALSTMARFAKLLKQPSSNYEALAEKAIQSFQKFWNPQRNGCFDVIDVPGQGNDASLRPNQLFAVSLPVSPLTPEQQKSVVDLCARELVTPFGLRSLAQGEPGYQGHYAGSQRDRDAAYHQGTVWGWLLGPFALAHLRVYNDQAAALRFLEPLLRHLSEYGLGTLGEIFDGDAPFTPRGTIAQAWTVGELLLTWHTLHQSSN